MLTLKGITKHYKVAGGYVEALKGLDVSFRKSEFVSILGPSGCGKTTTLNIVGGLDKYTSGDLIIAGKSTKNFTDRDWDVYRNHRIGFIFQSYNLIPHQTVLGNVELALTISGVSKEERVKRSLDALERVGLKGEEYKRPNQLSGGQCQRVAIARALVNEPDILLADEPTGALDSKTSVQIMDLIKEISKEKLVIMVTHNAELAEKYSTRIVRLFDGEMIEDTNPYSEEDEKKERQEQAELDTDNKNVKKQKKARAKMSWWTAFKLSLRNLFTKRGRTVLTSFAGSIGIIGISLILAVSQGTTAYINHVQETTLSSYPITLESQAIDLTTLMESFMGIGQSEVEHDNDAIYKDPIIYELVNALSKVEASENDLKSFKEYLETELDKEDSELSSAVSGIKYTYDLQFDVYTKNIDGEIIKSDTQELMGDMIAKYMMGVATGSIETDTNTSSGSMGMYSSMMMSGGLWQEILSAKDGGVVNPMVKDQYDLIHGDWPTEYNEVVLVVNERNELDDLTLYALGLIGEEKINAIIDAAIKGEELESEETKWTYKEVCEREYKIALPFNNYAKLDATNIWYDNSAIIGLDGMYEKGLPLKVTGIIRENPEAENHMISGSICYTYKLTEHIIEEGTKSTSVKAQLDSPNIDIFTGLPFNSSTGNMTDEEKKVAFSRYLETASDSKKAEIYIAIKSILPEETLNQKAGEMLAAYYPTTESQIELIANTYAMTMENVNAEQVKEALKELSPEYISGAALTICKGAVQMNTAKEVEKTIRSQCSSTEKAAQDVEISALLEAEINGNAYTDAQYALFYDTMTEFSESTYESNLKKLGYVDIGTPFTINIYASSFENKDVIVAAIDKYNQGVDEVSSIKYTDYMGLMMSSITTIIDAISYVLIAFVSISLVVSSIMIAVITLISVQERTKEIGILRSIGASKKDVSSMFNAETVIIGFASGLTGVLATYLLCIPINLILQALTGIPTLRAILPIGAAAILTLISVLLNLVSGLIPSRSAAKKDPVVALRTE